MSFSNSSLIVCKTISPNKGSRPSGQAIDTITIHCMAGHMTAEGCGSWFSKSSTAASSNYGIDDNGRIGLYVEEKDRSWCTSSSTNDNRAVTIEVSSDSSSPYKITDKAYTALIELCLDICLRNGIKQLIWKANKSLSVPTPQPSKQNMTVHRWYANKSCPGDYIYSRLGAIASAVNSRISSGSGVSRDYINSIVSGGDALIDSTTSSVTQTVAYTPRLTRPTSGNKYYITKSSGGYSNAVKGSPTDSQCDVLRNCVGYAYGRFNEIGQYGSCKYLTPCNAENFIENRGNLTYGQTPKLGACMVWKKGSTLNSSDGAGHVAIVEQINSSTQVVTSESGWNASSAFWTQTRNKGSGNWGMGSAYTFRGFIYNPAVSDEGTVQIDGVSSGVAIDTSNFDPYIVTVDPSVTSFDAEKLKEDKVLGFMFQAGYLYDASHNKRSTYRNSNLSKQVQICNDAGMIFALYAVVRARSKDEAKLECSELYNTISRYPPGAGIWLRLNFSSSQSKTTNHAILDYYYERISAWGLSNACGLYVSSSELEKYLDWDTYSEKYLLWLMKMSSSSEMNSVDASIDSSFFQV